MPDPAIGEPEPVVTETMAEVYVRQGHRAEALRVYRELLERTPGDERLRERVTELERDDRGSQAETAQWPSYAASLTGGQSVEALFRSLLDHRLGDAPPIDGAERNPGGPMSTGATEEPGHGAPTRPAQDPLSLSAIFGEEGGSGASPAARTSGATESGGGGPPPPGTPGYSFDQFFSGQAAAPSRPSSPGVRPSRPAGLEEDLDQFQNWLKSLKR
jgi:hypothetical protein